MVHHVARVLAFDQEKTGAKVALVVIDGLSLDQWLSLRASLLARDQSLAFTDGAVFAWVPTLTSVSRQAIFAGRAPLYFPNSLLTTDREPQEWAQLWADQGLGSNNIAYLKGLGDTSSLETVGQLLSRPGIKAVGLVVDTVDRIMHGMELGSRGMHGQIRQWAEEGFLRDLFTLLLGQGFTLYLTSDHGNIEAAGCGRPLEGSLADLRGERARSIRTPRSETWLLRASQAPRHGPAWACQSDSMPFLPPRGRHSFRPTSAQWRTVALQSKSWSCPSSVSRGHQRESVRRDRHEPASAPRVV